MKDVQASLFLRRDGKDHGLTDADQIIVNVDGILYPLKTADLIPILTQVVLTSSVVKMANQVFDEAFKNDGPPAASA